MNYIDEIEKYDDEKYLILISYDKKLNQLFDKLKNLIKFSTLKKLLVII